MDIFQYDFELPPERIAQEPAGERDSARLMVLQRASPDSFHGTFRNLPDWLREGDLLVVNDTRVLPRRLAARRRTGARLDLLLLEEKQAGTWTAMIKGAHRVKSGETILLGESGYPGVLHRGRSAEDPFLLDVGDLDVEPFLEKEGRAPLPPYIRREGGSDLRDDRDRERYQTIYARRPGAVAAPTAGLHFTPAVLKALEDKGIEQTSITLHVGPGTFLPVKSARIEDHRMHAEAFEVSEEAVGVVRRTRERGGRVIPVGTTSLRALESAADESGRLQPTRRATNLYIYPGYTFRIIDGLLTNFHLPRSTLIMLVAALAGLERIQAAYAEAIREHYRFYSYGDAMLIL